MSSYMYQYTILFQKNVMLHKFHAKKVKHNMHDRTASESFWEFDSFQGRVSD